MFSYFLVKLLAPWAGFLAFPVAIIVVSRFLQDKDVENFLVANTRGYLGENRVGRILEELPEGFGVFHDVDLGEENADHVVVGPGGVFNVEVKNYSGSIRVRPNGLYVNGKRNDKIIRQAWRQAHKLKELLGVEVEPVLVFIKGHLDGERVGRLPILKPDTLKKFLLDRPKRLTPEEIRQIFALLENKVR